MLVIHISLITVFMAFDTTERRKVAVSGVALVTEIPFVAMAARVDREVLSVVIEVGIPIRRGVAIEALLRVAFVVIGIVGVVEIRLVAEPAVGGSILELPVGVTL